MKIIALGDNSIDLYRNTGESFPGGNAVNVAVHAASAGARSEYLGSFGDDKMSQILQDALLQNNVDYSHCPIIPGKTTKVCCYQVVEGERSFLEVLTGKSWVDPIRLSDKEYSLLSTADLVVSSCNAKLPEQIADVCALPVIFAYDFGEKEKYRVEEYYDLVCRNGMDLAMFSCKPMNRDEFRRFCQPLHERGLRHVLATMGAEGQMLSNGTDILIYRPKTLKAFDTMGAGDAFLAGFLVSLFQLGWKKNAIMSVESLMHSLKAGSDHAAGNCQKEGGFGVRTRIPLSEIEEWEKML